MKSFRQILIFLKSLPGRLKRPALPAYYNPLAQFGGMLRLVLKRQSHHRGLTLLALVGIILAVGLVTDASFFSTAVDRVILLQELKDFSAGTGRPPFSTSVYYFPSKRAPVPLETAEKLTATVTGILTSQVGLPLRFQRLQVSSGGMMMGPAPDSQLYASGKNYLGDTEVVYVAGVSSHLKVEGQPFDDNGNSDKVLDVWMHQDYAQQIGVNLGETLQIGVNMASNLIPVRLAGFWRSSGPDSSFWFNDPDSAMKNVLLVRRNDYIRFVQGLIPSAAREVSWYIILDDQSILASKGAAYLDGFKKGVDQINQVLPGARLNMPPLDPLKSFVARSNILTVLLLAYNIPAFIILLYFLALTSGIIARWQRKETSILVSRGIGTAGVLNLAFLEQLLLFIPGYPLGISLGMLLARLMGSTASFLSFTGRPPLPVSLEGLSWPLAILALSISMLARLLPALQVARKSKVAEEREWARPARMPFWHRAYLDLVLLLPVWYAYDQMVKKGSLSALVTKQPGDLFNDPLLILVPALFIITIALVTMRLFSLTMRLADLLASRTPWITVHLALRQLGRQSQDYLSPLLLVIVALALGVYTLSMAASLDQWLVDRTYYNAGADMTIRPVPNMAGTTYLDGGWIPDAQEFLRVPGVASAVRVGDFFLHYTPTSGEEISGRFLAIDRLDFPQVAWYRRYLSKEDLGSLMNKLAAKPDGILVSPAFLADNELKVGDKVTAVVGIVAGAEIQSDFTIVGVYDYFPTVYEDQKMAVIGNLDNLTEQFSFIPPFDIWLKLKPGTDRANLPAVILHKLSIQAQVINDAQANLTTEQAKMERVGIFGTLTTGFLATAIMAILGLLLYSYASLRESVFRFGVLQAVGVLRRQIISQVVIEYAFLSTFGVAAGALVGMAAARLFIPFFRYTGGKGVPLPPLVPIIAGDQVLRLTVAFTLIVVVAEVLTISASIRQRLAQVLRA
jgi:putative ABC transport system permease protein